MGADRLYIGSDVPYSVSVTIVHGGTTDSLEDLQHNIAQAEAPAAAFWALPAAQRRDVFFHLPESLWETVVGGLEPDQVRQFLRRLDPDEGTDVLGLLDEATRGRILQSLSEDRREKLEFLLEFTDT